MTWLFQNHRTLVVGMASVLSAILLAGIFSEHQNAMTAHAQPDRDDSRDAAKARLHGIVKGILSAWDRADVVCLGEAHGGQNDSDLRIALVEHPDFIRKVNIIIVECANIAHQDIMDRFILEGEEMSREKLLTNVDDLFAERGYPICHAGRRLPQRYILPIRVSVYFRPLTPP